MEDERRCLRCDVPLIVMGNERLRIGGTSGGWKLLFGEWAELGEELLDVDIWVCSRCRRMEFALSDESIRRAETVAAANHIPDAGETARPWDPRIGPPPNN